jgi:uncharacterized protein YggE
MSTKPDTIKVTAFAREEIFANRADIFVTVKGSSLLSGEEALKKAREVAQLVDELTRFGLPMSAIHLQSVHAESASGGFLRSSSATYRLRIRCEKLDQVPDLLGIIASQKNAAFERIDWQYPEDAAHEKGLAQAIEKASAKARKIAEALGVRLLGVHDLSENTYDQEAPGAMVFAAQAKSPRSMGVVPQAADMGMDIQHAKTVQYNVEIEFRVSAFE